MPELIGKTMKIIGVGFTLFTVMAGLAVAKAEPIIVFDSGYNRDWAVSRCWGFRKEVAPPEADPAAVFDCQTTTNTRGLGRKLESEVQNKFSVTARCNNIAATTLCRGAGKVAQTAFSPERRDGNSSIPF
jgi:hypothetical protein